MSEGDLDPQIIAAVKKLASEAKEPALRSAAHAIFAALQRTDAREREAWEIVRAVADDGVYIHEAAARCVFCKVAEWETPNHAPTCPVTRARQLLATF